jgi:ceramide glucosyltransferase
VTHLADDFRLAALARARGLHTILSPCAVATDVAEARVRDLIAHELRWLRTIRMIQPLGYLFTFITFTLPVATAGYLMSGRGDAAALLLTLAVLARLGLHYVQLERPYSRTSGAGFCTDLVLLCMRDCLSLGLWAAAFFGRRVSWRGQMLAAEAGSYTTAVTPAAKEIRAAMWGPTRPRFFNE